MEGRRACERENAREMRKTGCGVTRKMEERESTNSTREGEIKNGRVQKRKRWI